MRHVRDLLLSLLPFGNILRGRYPTAFLHRLLDHAYYTLGQCLYDPGTGFTIAHGRNDTRGKLLRLPDVLSGRLPVLDQINQRQALEDSRRQSHPLGETSVKQNNMAIRIKHAKPLRHILKSSPQHDFLLPQLAIRQLEFVRVATNHPYE